MLPDLPSLKLPRVGGLLKLEGGLWKARLGLVLRSREFDTVRLRPLPAISFGGLIAI